eukprot:2389745-Pleurochrysis_carterae.AAC.1
MVSPQPVPGFSNLRWYSKAEIVFVIAENFGILGAFLAKLEGREYGDVARKKLRAVYDDVRKCHEL